MTLPPRFASHPTALGRLCSYLLLAIALPVLLSAGLFAADAKVAFDVPAGDASQTLKRFAEQAGRQIVYNAEAVHGVQTSAIKGDLSVMDAIGRMLAGTDLHAVQDEQTGALAVNRGSAPAKDANDPNVQRVARMNSGHPSQSPESPATATGSISGSVTRPSGGKSVKGLTVTVEETGQFTITDGYGRFSIAGIIPGAYSLSVSGEGYSRLKITGVVVRPHEDTVLAGEMMPAVKAGNLPASEEYSVEGQRESDVIALEKYEVKDRTPFTDENVDIVRTMDDVQPYFKFSSEDIENSGAVDVQDYLLQRLTMNTSTSIGNEINGSSAAGTSVGLNLRGLGTGQTLVLINGRPSSSYVVTGSSYSQPNLNAIPLAAIDRIEVLPDSASAIYGAGAEGGVINVVLKTNYTGGEIRATYENTFNANAPIRTIDGSVGLSFEGGKTNLLAFVHYSDAKPLLLQDRTFLIDYTNRILANNPSLYQTATSPFLGSTPNISSTNGANLVLKNGVSLGSPITFVPPGYSSGSDPTTLAANAGRYNLNFPPTVQTPTGLLGPLTNAPRTKSFGAILRREMTDRLQFFAEFFNGGDISLGAPSVLFNSAVVVPAAAPSNPFQQAVAVRFPAYFPNTSYGFQSNIISRSATAGFKLQLPGDWKSEFDYSWSSVTSNYGPVFTQDLTALNPAILAGTFNPFVDTLRSPPNFAPYVGFQHTDNKSSLNDVGLRFSGPLPHLPGGDPDLTFGVEHQKQGFGNEGVWNVFPTAADDLGIDVFGQSRTVDSVFAELRVPVIGVANSIPAIRRLDFDLAGRSDRYRTGATTANQIVIGTPAQLASNAPIVHSTSTAVSNNPMIGLRYEPVEGIKLRASYSTAFLPPSFQQLTLNAVPATITVFDPLRGGAAVVANDISGGSGNPALQPEKSKDWTVGVILEPKWAPGLRISLDWYSIKKTNQIALLSAQTIVNGVATGALPSALVVRNTPVSGDPYGVGTIASIQNEYLNLFSTKNNGFDLSAEYRLHTQSAGTFDFSALATLIEHDKVQLALGAPYVEEVGFPDSDSNITGGPPIRLQGNATLKWEFRNWILGWTTDYFGSYRETGPPISPSLATIQAQGSDHIPGQIYHNVFGTYRFGKAKSGGAEWSDPLFSGWSISVGIKDVFNTAPPMDANYSSFAPYSRFGSVRLRDYRVSLDKTF